MTAKKLSLSQFQKLVNNLAPELEAATIRGLQKSALYLNRSVVLEISHAEPYPAVDTGELRNSVDTRFLPNGAIVSVDAPHAAHIEYGTRPGKMPPLEPLAQWVLRKGIAKALVRQHMKTIRKSAEKLIGKTAARKAMKADKQGLMEQAAMRVAFRIARKIKQNGIAPRHYFKKAWERSVDRMVLIVNYEIAKAGWKPLPGTAKKLKRLFKQYPGAGGGGS